MKKIVFIIILALGVVEAQNIHTIPKLNSGELSDDAEGRVDTTFYYSGMRTQENFLSEVYGGILKRPGTYYIAEANGVTVEISPEVEGDYTRYLVGFFNGSYGNIVVMANTDGTIDTDWGTNGFWGNANVSRCDDILSLSDGRYLIAHDKYTDGASQYSLTMLNSDGSVDTSWADIGRYDVVATPWTTPAMKRMFEKDNGEIVVIAGMNAGHQYGYHLIDTDGTTLLTRQYSTAPSILASPYDACWYDDNHDRIIVVGNPGNYPGAQISNCFALDPDTLEPDTNWGGGLGYNVAAGYASIGPDTDTVGTDPAYNIAPYDDGFVIHHGVRQEGDYYTISKINLAGTAYDTDWADSGHAGDSMYPRFYSDNVGRGIASDDDYVYIHGSKAVNGILDYDLQRTEIYNKYGVLVDSQEFQASPTSWWDVYHIMYVIDGIVYYGTRDGGGAYDDLENWGSDLSYNSSYEIAGSSSYKMAIIPDETTRVIATEAVTEERPTGDAVRLLSFEHSQEQAHVLEFGEKYMRIFQ